MYVPTAFRADDPLDVVRAEPFAVLVSLSSGEATHVPLVPTSESPLVLVGHVAAASPFARDVERGAELLAIFSGPHAYVSPRDYVPLGLAATAPHVPTWNYVATHVRGTAHVLDGERAYDVLDRLTARFEPDGGWSRREVPASFVAVLAKAIVAFELRATEVVGKAKLSQNRTGPELDAAIAALEGRAPSVAAAMTKARPPR